jgi:glycosyltransferase involved in cell wall biosynthesis
VRNGTDGLLAPLGRLEILVEMTLELLQNPVRRRQMGVAARARAAETFSTERVATLYENLYRSVLGEGA